MALIIEIKGNKPSFGDNCFLAANATIVGDVTLGDNCSIWFQAVVRGDVNKITIGSCVNVQDAAIIHCTYKQASTLIGDNVSIGHRAIIHGCTLEDNVLIGMGAIIMDHAVVGKGSIVAAGALVLENTQIEPNSIYAGVPAKWIKTVDKKNEGLNLRIARNYLKYSEWY